MSRNLNLIHLIGNLTRDPELRYTGNGTAICTFGLATNRSWKAETGEQKEERSYHRVVAWEKLAELCAQLLVKGRKVYVQGRLAYRTYQKDDEEREVVEIVIDDMLLLDPKPTRAPGVPEPAALPATANEGATQATATGKEQASHSAGSYTAEEIADAIPF